MLAGPMSLASCTHLVGCLGDATQGYTCATSKRAADAIAMRLLSD